MFLDELEFEFAQSAGFGEDFAGHHHLAHVMDSTGNAQAGLDILVKTHLRGDGGGQLAHPTFMSSRVGIPQLNHLGNGTGSAQHGALQAPHIIGDGFLTATLVTDVPAGHENVDMTLHHEGHRHHIDIQRSAIECDHGLIGQGR